MSLASYFLIHELLGASPCGSKREKELLTAASKAWDLLSDEEKASMKAEIPSDSFTHFYPFQPEQGPNEATGSTTWFFEPALQKHRRLLSELRGIRAQHPESELSDDEIQALAALDDLWEAMSEHDRGLAYQDLWRGDPDAYARRLLEGPTQEHT